MTRVAQEVRCLRVTSGAYRIHCRRDGETHARRLSAGSQCWTSLSRRRRTGRKGRGAKFRGNLRIKPAVGISSGNSLNMFKAVSAYTKSLAEVARWRLGYTFALVVISSLTEGLGLALLLPTLQLAGVDIGSGSAAGRYAALVREGFGAVGLRPSLGVDVGDFRWRLSACARC